MRRDNLRLEERKKQMDKSKSQRHRQIKVSLNWQFTDEVTPAFKRLMTLLLKPRGNPPVKIGEGKHEP